MTVEEMHEAYMQASESARNMIALMTGVKRQFIEAGWDEHTAELATVNLFNPMAHVGRS